MSSPLKQNTTTIQELLNTITSLPEAGTDLPELINEGSASDLLSGKQLIDSDGNVVDGTFTIDTELDTQDNLISQIQTALQNKAAATGEDITSETNAYTTKLATLETAISALETELQGKASGGSGGGSVKTCTVSMDDYSNTATLYYTDADMTHKTLTGTGTVSVPINTIIVLTISSPNAYYASNGNSEPIYTYTNHGALKVYDGGCTITIYNLSGGSGA